MKNMLHLKTKCQANQEVCLLQLEQWLGNGWEEWQGRCLLTVISTHIAELIVFAFSDNLSAENSKFSADSRIHGIHFFECIPKHFIWDSQFKEKWWFSCKPESLIIPKHKA